MMATLYFSNFCSGKYFEAERLLIVRTDKYAEDDILLHNDMTMLTFIIIIMSQDNVTDYSP